MCHSVSIEVWSGIPFLSTVVEIYSLSALKIACSPQCRLTVITRYYHRRSRSRENRKLAVFNLFTTPEQRPQMKMVTYVR